uniref:Uncharacterized protein n=1 Tax=Panagrolaimus sp. ES5 TaxID=591445 RepID=A0AC34G4Q5_9BILA
MNAKLFFIFALFAIVGSIFAFDPVRIVPNDKYVTDFTGNATDLLSQSKLLADRPCKGIPGCFQFMCNKCCGDCNSGDCVTAMCMLCCG